jgi:hypothetical protein
MIGRGPFLPRERNEKRGQSRLLLNYVDVKSVVSVVWIERKDSLLSLLFERVWN